jgi:hypothetical protein
MQRYQHQEATFTLHHHMEHMNDDKEDEEDDEDCTEDEKDDDLLDELVVAAIRTSCIEYNTDEEEKEDNKEIYNQPTMVSTRKRRRAQASLHMEEYTLAGFPGAVGSTDATHIMLERVNYRFWQSHMGFKMTHTAQTYIITVNHRSRILATTQGHPACWNDKTLSLFDDFMQQLQHGDMSCLNCTTVMKMEQLSSDSIKALSCWLTTVTCHIQRLFLLPWRRVDDASIFLVTIQRS